MKLDLNKSWVLRLVSQSSTANGCSFIRGVILHTIWNVIIWIAAVTGASLLAVALGVGAYMWFHEPTFFGSEFPDRLGYFGQATSDMILAIVVFCGGLVWAIAGVLGVIGVVIWLLINGLVAAHPAVSSAAGKVRDAITPSNTFQEAVSAWYHKFCPEIEFILPDGYETYKVGARIARRNVSWTPDGEEQVITWPEGTITSMSVEGARIDLDILWDEVVVAMNDYYDNPEVKEEYNSPEELELARKYSLALRNCDYRLWFGSDNSEFKIVEETSSPV